MSGLDPSPLWKEFIKSFSGSDNNDLRGYALNSHLPNEKLIKFKRFLPAIRVVPRALFSLGFRIEKVSLRLLSRFTLGEALRGDPFRLKSFNWAADYAPELLEEFDEKFNPLNIYFSHNGIKLFSYLKTLTTKVNFLFSRKEPLLIVEIGAGVFAFGHLLASQLKAFTYIVVDLPEVISSARSEIARYKQNTNVEAYDVFEQEDHQEFFASNSKRKVLFVSPSHIELIKRIDDIDLFINHESFSEMNIETVNTYLGIFLIKLKRKSGVAFLVNRHSRFQKEKYAASVDNPVISDITCFSDYKLDLLDDVFMGIDLFRHRLPNQSNHPNISYIGIRK